MADIIYNRGAHVLMQAAINVITLDLRAVYVYGTLTGVDNRDLNTVSEIDALNSGATNLSTSRQTVANESSAEDDTNDWDRVDSDNITFPSHATETPAVAMLLYHEGSGTDATRDLVSCYTTGFPQPVTGGLVVTVNGIIDAKTV